MKARLESSVLLEVKPQRINPIRWYARLVYCLCIHQNHRGYTTVTSRCKSTCHLSSAQSLYALRVLRSHGFDCQSLQTLFLVTVISKLQYSSSAWWPLVRVHKRHPSRPAGTIPLEGCQSWLPHKELENTERYMRDSRIHALPEDHNESMPSTPSTSAPKNVPSYDLRPRTQKYHLPDKRDNLVACNFMTRMLYKLKYHYYWLY